MKISLFLLFFAVLQLQANNGYAQRTRISITLKSATIEQVLDQIEKKSDFVFLYNDKTIDTSRKVSVEAEEKEISQILSTIFAGTNVSYTVIDKQIILSTNKTSLIARPQQNVRLKGSVVDIKGEPLIGVNIVVKGTTIGVITDLDGYFELDVPETNKEVVISYIGYKTQEILLTNKTKELKIVLQEDTNVLGEVVVTAMGIERKAASLTYATQQVNNKELTRAKDVNFINSLQGKSAGLTITPNASGAGGGSSKIILRGQSSILGNNQPLIVLDGIPMSNGMSSQTNEIIQGVSRDGGDILSTINPDDIANISILKGPNAAALYGSAANNGVILITTKGGQEGKVRIDVSSNTTMETPLMYPQQQTEFAPEFTGGSFKYNAWGKRISELSDDELAMHPYLTRNPGNNVTDFYETGQTYNNSVSLNSGTENSTTYFSYGNTVQKGLIENNKFVRHNLLFKESYNLFNKRLKLDFSLNYITQRTKNRPVIGLAKGALPGLYRTPAAVDLRYFDKNRTRIAEKDDPLVTPGSSNGVWNSHLIGMPVQNFPWLGESFINNPYFMLDAVNDDSKRERLMASFTAKVEIVKGLTAQARASVDKITDDGVCLEYATIRGDKQQTIASTYWGSKSTHREIYSDYLLTYDKNFDDKVNLNVTGGTSFKRINNRPTSLSKFVDSTYVMPNIPWPGNDFNGTKNPDNAGGILKGSDSEEKDDWEAAVFATAQIGFWNKAYVDMSIRNDWAKPFQQFAKNGRYKGFIYYSFGGNVLLKEALPFTMPKVNSLKLRASYSVVGNSIPSKFYYAQTINPLTGAIGAASPTFDNPKPETTKAFEIGLDGVLFDNRLSFDLTVYQSTMENQFLEYTTSSGQKKPVNSGKVRNRGVEFSTTYNLLFGQGFRWSTGINLAYNDNKILKTFRVDNVPVDVNIGASSLSIQSRFIEGGSYGDLYAKDFLRDKETGKIMLSAAGSPQFGNTFDRYIGNTTARFTYGWNNTFSYKNFSLYLLLDGKIGGKVISYTESEMDRYGLSKRTAEARNNGNKVILPDGQEVDARKYYEAVGSEQFDCAYDATNIRVREMSLGYTFYDLFGSNRNLSLSLVGRNLGFLYKNAPVDPDISVTASNALGGIDAYALPTTRSFGLNIKFNF